MFHRITAQGSIPRPPQAEGSSIPLALSLFMGTLVLVSTLGAFVVANDEIARHVLLMAFGTHSNALPEAKARH